MKASVSRIGELVIWEQEGGYATPTVGLEVEEDQVVNLEEMLAELIPGLDMDGGKKGITLEVTFKVVPR